MIKFILKTFFKVIEWLFFFLEDFILRMIQVFIFIIFFDDGKIVDGKINIDIARIFIQIH